ncbi:hypothetical protein GGR53DRAFT_484661 [Hypoxylon sp. FL1150]|nr:hypothetical protein GGR53DRAFT_484661 [Hypoxylon sp. FL1150]
MFSAKAFVLPDSMQDWLLLEKKFDLVGQSIGDGKYTDSASEMGKMSKNGMIQYILIRSITLGQFAPGLTNKYKPYSKWIKESYIKEATRKLGESPAFQEYRSSFEHRPSQLISNAFPLMGPFSLVRRWQIDSLGLKPQIQAPVTRPRRFGQASVTSSDERPSTPVSQLMANIEDLHLSPDSPSTEDWFQKPVEDEQIVVLAFFSLLGGIMLGHQHTIEWTSCHLSFHVRKLVKGEWKNIFEARTDGGSRRAEIGGGRSTRL